MSLCGWILFIVFLLVAVAYYTLAERKLMGFVQRRVGPNVVGFAGTLQPAADGVKLILKEPVIPTRANSLIFVFAPGLMLTLSFIAWCVVPLEYEGPLIDLPHSLLFIYGLNSLGVYGIIMCGWASNSKYAFLGAMRSVSQMISYEVPFGFTFAGIGAYFRCYDLAKYESIQDNSWRVGFPYFLVFFICSMAETNRSPFDLPEAEAELVAGYNIEYGSARFALLYLSEYTNMLLMNTLAMLIFSGGTSCSFMTWLKYNFPVFGKILVLSFLFILLRATLPRVRYDVLMKICWKILLPSVLIYLMFWTFKVEVFLHVVEVYERYFCIGGPLVGIFLRDQKVFLILFFYCVYGTYLIIFYYLPKIIIFWKESKPYEIFPPFLFFFVTVVLNLYYFALM